jgi:hypothetical protein
MKLPPLKANDILPYENVYDINPSITLQIKEKNQIKKAYFFEKDKDNYWLTTSSNHLVYQLSSVYISSLKKTEEDFIQ